MYCEPWIGPCSGDPVRIGCALTPYCFHPFRSLLNCTLMFGPLICTDAGDLDLQRSAGLRIYAKKEAIPFSCSR